MSEKNRLQEYCQKNKIPLPIYKSWSNGEPHRQQWSAAVTIQINGKNITVDTIIPSISKTSAEKQAAIMMLDHIRSKKNTDPKKISHLSKLKKSTIMSINSTHKSLFSKKYNNGNTAECILHTRNTSDELQSIESDCSDKLKSDGLKSHEPKAEQSNSDDSGSEQPNSDDSNSSDTPKTIEINMESDSSESDNPESDNPETNDDEDNDKDNDHLQTELHTIKHIYIIDLENKPVFKQKTKSDSLYIGFINSIHHSIVKYSAWHKCKTDDLIKEISESKNYKLLYTVEGGVDDLVDHFMTVFIYPILVYIKENDTIDSINIISGDHAGWCTRTCLEKIFKWHKINYININNATTID